MTTSEEQNIDNSMSADMSLAFKRFSHSPTKASHPLDERRFFDFIIQAHNEEHQLDEDQLRELLRDESWSKDDAQRISSLYRFGRDLLKRYSEPV